MAADRQRKRLNGVSIAACNFQDHYRIKKKKLESLQNDLSTKSCISLEWDGNQERVVAKREQIGLTRRHLRPFGDSEIHYNRVLADVLTLPREIFDLENLTEVLSYEVWQSLLSENERNLLMQFLPTGTDKERVVQALLAGDSFHFGNPFLKWSSLLCSGHLHPDVVIQEEQRLKAEKKAYFSELQDYHNDIIDHLQRLKVKWESFKGTEEELVHKLWRMYEKGFIKDKGRLLLTAPYDTLTVEARPRNGDKCKIQQNDGAKYMSYVKISKKQHKLIKNMRQSGKSIQSTSLDHVLGDINSLHVLPYEIFVEEEQRNLHEHWLRLVKEDLSIAYASRREIQLQKREIAMLLEQDMEEKLFPASEEEVEEDTGKLHDQDDSVGSKFDILDVDKEGPEKLLEDQKDAEATEKESSMEEDSVLALSQNQSPQQISSIDGGNMHNCEDVEYENKETLMESDVALSEHSKNLKTADATVNHEGHVSSSENVWSTYIMPHSHHGSTEGHQLTPCSGLPHTHQAIEDRQNHMIDLESGLHEESTEKDLLHGHSENGSFSSYPNQDRGELLQSFFKDLVILPYHSEQKQAGIYFEAPKNVLIENDDFVEQFEEQLQPVLPLEMRQKNQDEVYVQQSMSEDIYSDESRGGYLPPRQEHLPSGHMQDRGVTPAHMSAPVQHQLNSGQSLNQNWFTGEHQSEVDGGWAGSDGISGPSQSIAIARESNADQSLFSVVSQCNQLGLFNRKTL